MTDGADLTGSQQLEVLSSRGDWPEFFRAVRAGGERLTSDVAAVHSAYRLASASGRAKPVPGFRDVRVAILRNSTLEPWLPHVFAAFVTRGLIPTFWLGDYGVYEAYLTRELPGLERAAPEITLVHLDPEELVGDGALLGGPALQAGVTERLGRLQDLLADAHVGATILCNLTPPPDGVRDVPDSQSASSWPNVRRVLNATMVERFEDHPSVHILDLDTLAARLGSRRSRDARMYFTAHLPFSGEFMPIVARAFAATAAPIFQPPRKCLVVDGDNTLWGGVLGEDGPMGVKLGTEYPGSLYRRFQLFLETLKDQGTLLALNSKNDEAEVLTFLDSSPDSLLRSSDFAAHRINWGDKATNLREIAAELNIGLDAVVFVDDSAVECALVQSLMPEVRVRQFPADVLEIPQFIEQFAEMDVLIVTDEDRNRAASMRSNAERERLRTTAADLDTFIRSLDIRLRVQCQPQTQVGRVAQLTQRTNQFNLTTHRYTDEEVRVLMREALVYTLAMADRFSDYGTVGATVVRAAGSDAEIDSLLLSCRAFGREIELAFVDRVLADLVKRGVRTVWGTYVRTPKNAMVAEFYDRCGFDCVSSDATSTRYRRDLVHLEPSAYVSRYTFETEGLLP
ncbi:MAG: HAD-IIIC family phosphatase [Gemmatimonadota bacterium]